MSRNYYELLHSKNNDTFVTVLDLTERVEEYGKDKLLFLFLTYLEPAIKTYHNGHYVIQKTDHSQ